MAEIDNKPQEQVAGAAAQQRPPVQSVAAPQQPLPNHPASQQAKARPCPKDCRKCSMQQQICCSSLLSFQSFEVMNNIIQRLDAQSQRIEELEERLKAIQSSEAELSSPVPFQGDLFSGNG